MSDTYHTVRRGLESLIASWPEWRQAPLVLLRNRLLDECGGDARPYIALVVRAAELGVAERITEWGGVGVPWPTLRGSLVVSLTTEAFLRSDMATWAIDTWGLALMGPNRLGLRENAADRPSEPPSSAGQRTSGVTPDRVRQRTPTRNAPHSTTPTRGPTPRAPAMSLAQPTSRTYLPQQPSSYAPPRASPAVPRHGAALPRLSPHAPPEWMHTVTHVSLGVIVAGVLYLIVQVVSPRDPNAPRGTPDPGRSSSLASTVPVVATGRAAPQHPAASGTTHERSHDPPGSSSPATPMAGVARGALPPAANEPARLMIVQPPTRASGSVGPGASVLESQVALLATTKADRLELRSGRVLTGRVEVVRASVVLFRDAESGLRYEVAKTDIREITTEFGTKVRFGSAGDPQNEKRSPLVTRGLAGTYRVSYTFRDVRGSPECRSTEAQSIAPDVMEIEHNPGTDTLRLSIRGGSAYYGVVDSEGLFATALALQPDQARESSAYTSRLEGRFTPTGFDATFNLLAYRRVRAGRDITCHTTLNAVGEREVVSRPPSTSQ